MIVNAGPDQTICKSDSLFLSTLNAQITGLVNDGYWFTTGDGYFLPSFDDNVQFSIGSVYVPGPSDKITGGFELILVSFDPDGFGPLVQVSDDVHITLMGNIAMVCNSNLNIALGPDCTQELSPTMLVTNLVQPQQFYFLTLKDESGKKIVNNLLTSDHIGQLIEYSVGHECGTNTCWGYIKVEDKLPPPLFCTNKTLLCGDYTQADSLGLPIPALAKAKKTGPKSYRVTQLDACGPATLSYNDVYQPLLCETGFQGRITRTWNAIDSFGNTSSCFEVISIKNRSLEQVALPYNYDDIAKPAFECGDEWPKTAAGYPSPDTTGLPGVEGCTNLAATFTDTKIEACGASYKIIRKWTLINWCGTIITEHNQVIKVKDSLAPIALCPNDTLIYASPYNCGSLLFKLNAPVILHECSAWTFSVSLVDTFTGINVSQYLVDGGGAGPSVNGLPIGTYYVNYYLTDQCNNIDSCYYLLTVADNSVPTAICDQFTKVALDGSGTARLMATSLDDGSIDNCAIVEYKIAKMTDSCGLTPVVFKDFADFCCKESSQSIMVALRVTDFSGNSNTCMVEVQVQDKLPPSITCPPHLTISCHTPIDTSNLSFLGNIATSQSLIKPIYIYDAFNNGLVGYDGFYRDNCSGIVTSKVTDLTQCYQGLLHRTFTVSDKNGNSASCTQSIKIDNPDPFNREDIVFPANKEYNGCGYGDTDPQITGKPIFNNTKCANVGATFEDQIFTFTDGACVKIIRTWTVIDWCQFNATTGFGKWTGLQVLKYNNLIDPVFDTPCRDTVVCNYSENCGPVFYQFTPDVSDDCTNDSLLTYSWKIDTDNNGIFDVFGTAATIKANLGNGKHKVEFTVSDHCGNQKSCSYFVTVKDCKKPTPYCVSNITTVIMPSSGQLTIKANSFDLNSYDNCTPANQLKFSFSELTTDTLRTLTCADIPDGKEVMLDINMWVTDLLGNNEYCVVHLTLLDNGNACQDVGGFTDLSGLVWQAGTGAAVNKVNIEVLNTELDLVHQTLTNDLGKYNIEDVESGKSYKIIPTKNDSITEGLSTLDVILIQRHILGVTKFTDPIKIIASDMDGNRKVSVSDLVVLRKIILGASQSMPGNRDCYTFVDDKHLFTNPTNPFGYPDYIQLNDISGDKISGLDFISVKMGDVNFSLNLNSDDAENRTPLPLINLQKTDQAYVALINDPVEMTGFQLALPLVKNHAEIRWNAAILPYIDFIVQNNELRILFAPEKAHSFGKNEILFEILEGEIDESRSPSFSNQWYGLDLVPKALKWQMTFEHKPTNCGMQFKFNGNNLYLDANDDIPGRVEIKVYDLTGRLLSIKSLNGLDRGVTSIETTDLPSAALLFITFNAAGCSFTQKWIKT